MSPARPWLPPDCLDRPGVHAPIEAAVADWGAHWFARRGTRMARLWMAPPLTNRAALNDAIAPGVEAMWPIGDLVVAGAALDLELDRLEITEADRELLEHLERRIVEDLVSRIAALVEGGEPGARGAEVGNAWVTNADGHRFLRLNLDPAFLTALARRDMAPPRRAPGLRARLAEALGPVEVDLRVRLGEAEISLADLQSLSRGDVLVLDRPLSAGADLVVRQSSTSVAAAKLDPGGQRVVLQ